MSLFHILNFILNFSEMGSVTDLKHLFEQPKDIFVSEETYKLNGLVLLKGLCNGFLASL